MKINKKNSRQINEQELASSKIQNSHQIISVFKHPQMPITLSSIIYKPEVMLTQNRIFYPSKNNEIIQEALPINFSEFILNIELFKEKENLHLSLHDFVDEVISNKKTHKNCYSLFNYVSQNQLVCHSLEGLGKIAYCAITYEFDTAISMLEHIQKKNIYEQIILSIIKAYSGIVRVLKRYRTVGKCFLKRESFEMKNNENSEQLQAITTPLILFEFGTEKSPQQKLQTSNRFSNYSVEQQKSIVLANLNLLHNFLAPISFAESSNEYYQLILLFLKNKTDPLQSNIYLDFLRTCKLINLPDLFNFANKLLNDSQKFIFVREMENTFERSPNLTDMLYFSEEEQPMLCKIMQNFIDQYGDLQSAALVANEYNSPGLKKYMGLQNLVFGMCDSFSQGLEKKNAFVERVQIPEKETLFLSSVKIKEEKIQEPPKKQKNREQDNPRENQGFYKYHDKMDKSGLNGFMERHRANLICNICYKKPDTLDDLFVQCVKCMHGGHLSHLASWFKQNNVCSKIDCSCFCNA